MRRSWRSRTIYKVSITRALAYANIGMSARFVIALLFGIALCGTGVYLIVRGPSGKSTFVFEAAGLKTRLTNASAGTILALVGAVAVFLSLVMAQVAGPDQPTRDTRPSERQSSIHNSQSARQANGPTNDTGGSRDARSVLDSVSHRGVVGKRDAPQHKHRRMVTPGRPKDLPQLGSPPTYRGPIEPGILCRQVFGHDYSGDVSSKGVTCRNGDDEQDVAAAEACVRLYGSSRFLVEPATLSFMCDISIRTTAPCLTDQRSCGPNLEYCCPSKLSFESEEVR